jgi:pSer/pThr/pTyr-binding forkhead associated (FHA) protein
MPIILGRSIQAAFCITDGRVSRQHARIDGNAGRFTLTDLSFNGSYVRFSGNDDVLALRRNSCTLHGSGVIGLGSSPAQLDTPVVRFEVLHFADTQAHD